MRRLPREQEREKTRQDLERQRINGKEAGVKRLGWGIAVLACFLAAANVASLLGKAAPDFGLVDLSDTLVKLSEFRGRQNVVLVFYVNHG